MYKTTISTFCALALASAASGQLYGVMFRTAGQTNGQGPKLFDVDPNTGAASNPRFVNVNDLVGIAISPVTGDMYGLTDQFGRINNVSGQGGKNLIVKINAATGAATAVGRLDPLNSASDAPLAEFEGDLAFDSSGTLWGVSSHVNYETIFKVNLATGAGTIVSNVIPASGIHLDISAVAFSPTGAMYGLDTRYPDQPGPAILYQLDPLTGAILATYNTSTVLGNCAGMTFEPGTGRLLIADGDTGATANLYSFNFGTSNLDLIGATGASGSVPNGTVYTGFAGLAFAPAPGAGLTLLAAGSLLARRRRA